MTRERLPNRRASEVLSFQHGPTRYVGSVSRYSDGRIAEVFIDGVKLTTYSANSARESAIAASLALQHGVGLDVLSDALDRDERGEATGPLAKFFDLIDSTAAARSGCAGEGEGVRLALLSPDPAVTRGEGSHG